jgi:Putative Ig domain
MRRYLTLAASAGFAALLCGSSPATAQTIGTAQSFAIVGGAGVNANGSGSTVNGDVGINPAAASLITGFPANATITPPFSNHGNDATAISASVSTLTLYNSAVMAPAGATLIGGDNLSIGGPSSNGQYTPGRYTNAGGAAIMPTSITLNGAGIYVFTLANSLTASANVILNGVDPCSVFWRIPTQATLNGLIFPGTVVSNAIIALGSGVNVTGRALTTANGSVTLAGGDTIGGCSGAIVPLLPPTVTKAFSPASITAGGVSRLTITVSNANAAAIALTAALTDTLPSGVLVAPTPNPTTTCGGAVTATAGGSTVTLATGSTIPAGSCTIAVNVTAAAAGSFVNTIPAGALQTTPGNNAAPATATLAATPVFAPATLPNGTVGVPFGQTLTGSGGTPPFSFSVTAGALPAGVTLTPAGGLGLLSGTPTAPGTSTFTIRVTDSGGFFTELPFTMTIATGVPTLPQAFVLLLALGLIAVGYFRLRRRARAE